MTLPETNIFANLKNDAWNFFFVSFSGQFRPIFRGELAMLVSGSVIPQPEKGGSHRINGAFFRKF